MWVLYLYVAGVSGDALWRLLPRSMAFGIEHFQPWLAHLAAAGHVVVRRNGHFEVADLSQPPAENRNRGYIEELFVESGCTDLRQACGRWAGEVSAVRRIDASHERGPRHVAREPDTSARRK